GRPVAGAEALGQRQVGRRGVEDPAGGLDGAVAGDDETAVELGDLLDGLADPAVADVPLLASVAPERVEAERVRAGQHVAGITDNQQGADRLALAALAADLDGDVDDGLERL